MSTIRLRRLAVTGARPLQASGLQRHLALLSLDADTQTYLESLIDSAVEMVERDAGVVIRQATWEVVADTWPGDRVQIDLAPVQSVDAITYRDSDGVEQTIDPATLRVGYLGMLHACEVWAPTDGWPTTQEHPEAVRIQVTAGYADGTVPEYVLQTLRLVVTSWWKQRSTDPPAWSTGAGDHVVRAYRALLDRLRWRQVA